MRRGRADWLLWIVELGEDISRVSAAARQLADSLAF